MSTKLEPDSTPQQPELPKPQPPAPFSSLVDVDVYGLSHRGHVRPNNEDHFLVVRGGRTLEAILGNLPPETLCGRFDEVFYGMVVADGLGGEAGGEVASRRAIESLLGLSLQTPDWILRLEKPEINEVMWRMADRFIRVNAGLIQEASTQPDLQGMSTTMTLALTMGDDLILTHVGDSRAYLLRQGNLKQLTRDHTFAQLLLDKGGDEILLRELRNVLTQALGARLTECQPDVQHLKLENKDKLLLCTDGLTSMVDENAIEEVLKKANSARVASEELVNLALNNGGNDNITVVVATYSLPRVQ